MILYEWLGRDGLAYRIVNGIHAVHPMAPGQSYEVQVRDGRSWWPMVDWNAAALAQRGTEPKS